MHDVNWWLMALAFILGLVLTLFLMIRRVKREVPEYATSAAGAGSTGAAAAGGSGAAKLAGGKADADADTGAKPGVVAAGATAAAAGGAAAKFADTSTEETAKFSAVADEPYGAGSARVAAGAAAPSGYDIKGNEDSMLYHTTDSPSYKQTIAEVWFFDEATAERAGFTHWRKGRAEEGGAAKFAEVPPGPHGPGSAKPAADGSGPEGWTVKGNEDSMLYHSRESSAYDMTVAEVWFRDVPTAEAAGFNRWDSGKSQRGKQ